MPSTGNAVIASLADVMSTGRPDRNSDSRLDCAGKQPGGILPSGELRRCRTSVHGEPLSLGTIADVP
jgi:hypothetical protein